MLVIQSTSMHGASAAARLRAATRELGPQRKPTTGRGWGTQTAAEHLQGPTGDPTGSSRVREGCFRQGNRMCHCRPADRMLALETPRSPQGPGGESGRKAQGRLLGGQAFPAKGCGPHHTRRREHADPDLPSGFRAWQPFSEVALAVKNPAANGGDARHTGSIPVLGRSPSEGHDNPLQYSCLENPMDRGAW